MQADSRSLVGRCIDPVAVANLHVEEGQLAGETTVLGPRAGDDRVAAGIVGQWRQRIRKYRRAGGIVVTEPDLGGEVELAVGTAGAGGLLHTDVGAGGPVEPEVD